MPADEISVNLLGHDPIGESPIGRIVTWATTYGRYIMILTEVVVLLAFLSRFSLDRKLTDLNEAIEQKQAIIEANVPFETEILALQNQLAKIKTIISAQEKPIRILNAIKSVLPADVYLQKLTISKEVVRMKAIAQSTAGFTVFVNNLQTIREFTKVDMNDIKKSPAEGILFELNAQLMPEKKPIVPEVQAADKEGEAATK
jgi:Tfp pilus assembly protein PilN